MKIYGRFWESIERLKTRLEFEEGNVRRTIVIAG